VFGLFSEFWFPDELQIYLIGLKSFTTGTWPYYGPDLVYTNTQIAGALQGLLVSLPFYVAKFPESPTVFLNILSFGSLSLLAIYITKRLKNIPVWLVWVMVMTTPWAMHYSTRVVNPSYAVLFSVPFFISAFELLPFYKDKIVGAKLAYPCMGLCTALIMQLHMSWVMLVPIAGIVFLSNIKADIKKQALHAGLYILGAAVGALTLYPSLLLENTQDPSASSNIVLNAENWSNLPVILMRFFSFASNEIPYVLGGSTAQRLEVVKDQLWMSPFVVVLLLAGFAQVGTFLFFLFKKKIAPEFKMLKLLLLATVVLLYLSFFFSVKGPSSHTFYIMFPLAVFYAFNCYQWLIEKKKIFLTILKVIAVCQVVFHIGLGAYNFKTKSLYKDRGKVVKALDDMDYKILGERRADEWGYGY